MADGRCEFKYGFPFPVELIYLELGSSCQFTDETEVFDCNGELYCRFHLPMTGSRGRDTVKKRWDREKREDFNKDILNIIETAIRTNKPANLIGVVFPSSVDFSWCIFQNKELPECYWLGTTFSSYAYFEGAIFSGNAYFDIATFSGGSAKFRSVKFKKNAQFIGATFLDSTVGGADFEDAIFMQDAKFSAASIANANFRGATFLRGASFHGARFLGDAEFIGAKFLEYTIYIDVQEDRSRVSFPSIADFRDTVFERTAIFKNAEFADDADFSWSGAKVRHEDSNPAASGTFQEFDFRGGFVTGSADFSDRTFKQAADFSDRRFERPPLFHGATLHQGTKWRDTTFTNTTDSDAEQAYRTLRLHMEQIRDRPQEGVFFALEQRAMRRQAEWWRFRSLLSLAYDLTSDYGRSAGRPLIWLGIVSFIFLLAYGLLAGPYFARADRVLELLSFIVQQVAKPLALWGPIKAGAFFSNFSDVAQFWFRVAATFQSLFSLGLITLFILALRWQFRRG